MSEIFYLEAPLHVPVEKLGVIKPGDEFWDCSENEWAAFSLAAFGTKLEPMFKHRRPIPVPDGYTIVPMDCAEIIPPYLWKAFAVEQGHLIPWCPIVNSGKETAAEWYQLKNVKCIIRPIQPVAPTVNRWVDVNERLPFANKFYDVIECNAEAEWLQAFYQGKTWKSQSGRKVDVVSWLDIYVPPLPEKQKEDWEKAFDQWQKDRHDCPITNMNPFRDGWNLAMTHKAEGNKNV